ncbi:unnamed protein product [Bursaphelenchus okinawaensis]|uniref:FYVE-type domain-containing protein n=1 Tax=Bursaphelenchus okinawaensis TaxID=465554 RepID=A0A811LA42_9BILA|nr:unnamed protein product [Bursaphelenchus okinawaensis]CAG9119699.1 unnamed protein product [Bursaphelenchus okinawaensis]
MLCPFGWHYYSNKCYFLSNYSLTYKSAEDECKGRYGASLASLHSNEEDHFVHFIQNFKTPSQRSIKAFASINELRIDLCFHQNDTIDISQNIVILNNIESSQICKKECVRARSDLHFNCTSVLWYPSGNECLLNDGSTTKLSKLPENIWYFKDTCNDLATKTLESEVPVAVPVSEVRSCFSKTRFATLKGIAGTVFDRITLNDCLGECWNCKNCTNDACRTAIYYEEEAQCILTNVSVKTTKQRVVKEDMSSLYDRRVKCLDNNCEDLEVYLVFGIDPKVINTTDTKNTIIEVFTSVSKVTEFVRVTLVLLSSPPVTLFQEYQYENENDFVYRIETLDIPHHTLDFESGLIEFLNDLDAHWTATDDIDITWALVLTDTSFDSQLGLYLDFKDEFQRIPIYAIGIGNNLDFEKLQIIASSSDNVFFNKATISTVLAPTICHQKPLRRFAAKKQLKQHIDDELDIWIGLHQNDYGKMVWSDDSELEQYETDILKHLFVNYENGVCVKRKGVSVEWIWIMNFLSTVLPHGDQFRTNSENEVGKEYERQNLLTITKLVLNTFLERSIKGKRVIEADTQELSDLLVMLEKVLFHGLKKNVIKKQEQCLWDCIGLAKSERRDLAECISCINGLQSLQTPTTKIRAFLRLSLMQKKLADYFQVFTSCQSYLSRYEPWALMKSDGAETLAGSLFGLSVFDCNLVLDFEHLREQLIVFDISTYVKVPTIVTMPEYQAVNEDEKILKAILDQKCFLEEHNRSLISRLEAMKHKNNNDQPLDKALVFTERFKDLEDNIHTLNTKLAKKEEMLQEANATAIKRLAEVRKLEKMVEVLEIKLNEITERNRRMEDDKIRLESVRFERVVELDPQSDDIVKAMLDKKNEECAELSFVLSEKQRELTKFMDKTEQLESKCLRLQTQADSAVALEKELNELKSKFETVDQEARESQKALEELGGHLSESKLKVVELKEELLPLSEAQWVKDDEVTHCRGCELAFSVTHRKHHCRNCGWIFCNACSDCRIKLPSNSKPVRVCENCYSLLQARHNTFNTSA